MRNMPFRHTDSQCIHSPLYTLAVSFVYQVYIYCLLSIHIF